MNPDSPNPLTRLLSSTKGIVALFVVALAFGALFANKASWDQVKSLLEWVLTTWFAAHTAEDVTKHYAKGRLAVAVANNAGKPAETQVSNGS